MRYVVTVYCEASVKPVIELVGDCSDTLDTVCLRYSVDTDNMAHSIYVWDWNQLTMYEYNMTTANSGDYREISK